MRAYVRALIGKLLQALWYLRGLVVKSR